MSHITSIKRGTINDVCYPSLPSRSVFLKLCSVGPLFSARFEEAFREKKIKKTENISFY
jgi:hypothetical protein